MIDGYLALGRELFDQLDGRLDAIAMYVGTGGCFLGTTRALRERLPELHRVAVEPAESAVLSGGQAGTHRIEGGGVGFVPPLLTLDDDVDEVIAVSDRGRVRDGAAGRARGRDLVGTFDRREHRRGAHARPTARRGRASRHDPGRFGVEVPRR